MIRRLFTIASLISLLFCLATAALLVKSYVKPNMFVLGGSNGSLTIHPWAGTLVVVYGREAGRTDTAVDRSAVSGRAFGFIYSAGIEHGTDDRTVFAFKAGAAPLWEVLAVFSIPPLWSANTIRRRRRLAYRHGRNRCLECGYSLTGNTSGVCPECGTAVPQRSEAAT